MIDPSVYTCLLGITLDLFGYNDSHFCIICLGEAFNHNCVCVCVRQRLRVCTFGIICHSTDLSYK